MNRCDALLRPCEPGTAEAAQRETALAEMVLTDLKPDGFSAAQWTELVQEWAACMAHHEKLVMASSTPTKVHSPTLLVPQRGLEPTGTAAAVAL